MFSSCRQLSGSGNDLRGTSWQLVSYGEKKPLEGKAATANFSASEISGSTSCNQYFGSYEIKGDQISIDGLGWTEMACLDPDGIMEQEQEFMGLLSKAETLQVESNQLSILTGSGILLQFIPLEQ
jgi:putative lipoprotein